MVERPRALCLEFKWVALATVSSSKMENSTFEVAVEWNALLVM
jgi:hypothetical protein